EAEDVAYLHEAARRRSRRLQLAPLGGRSRDRLFDEAVKPRGQALARDRVMAVRRRDDVRRVDVRERLAIIDERAARVQTTDHRPFRARRRPVSRPDGNSELAEYTQVLLAPTAEADQQDVHGERLSRGRRDRRPRPRRPRNAGAGPSSTERPAGPRRPPPRG